MIDNGHIGLGARYSRGAQASMAPQKYMDSRSKQGQYKSAQNTVHKKVAQAKKQGTALKSQKQKALEIALHEDVQKMILHMQTAQQHWMVAMKIFASSNAKIKSLGVNPMNTNFYKNLSYIDDVYEGMGMFINKAKEVLKL